METDAMIVAHFGLIDMGKTRKIKTIISEHEGLRYFYHKNEWNIHDGKSILYVVKDKELIKQLDKNKKVEYLEIDEIFFQ